MVEVKMAENQEKSVEMNPTCMQSVNRIVKLPVVESSIQTATNVYGKVKDLNEYTKWGLETMESTIHSVVENGKPYAIPVVQKFDGPIKKVDSVLCSGLDYVEAKVPAMKLPPGELYTTTKDYVHGNVSPKVHAVVDPAVEVAKSVVDPAVQAARKVTDPAYKMVEPLVQPAMDKANAIKDYGVHKVEEFLRRESKGEEKQLVRYSQSQPSMTSFYTACNVALYNLNIYSDAQFPYIHFVFNFHLMMIENYELS